MPRPERPARPAAGLARLLRPKGNLPRAVRLALLALAILPLGSVALRSLALPGLAGVGPGALGEVGDALNRLFSLSAVPVDQREHVLYLLFLPTAAMLVALARLTFGIRVLGFRSILISVGFHQSGIVPSLLLIAVAVAAIIGLRPWLRRIRLPYYARVSVILGVVAMTMVAGLMAGPWLQADILWGAAYFPVIVLGMLAEGIAHTLERDDAVTASWRAITTLLLAFVIALIGWAPPLRDVLLQFPELVLTQIVAVVMISEVLDLRLLQGWERKVAGMLAPRRMATARFRVAVIREGGDPGVRAGVDRAASRRASGPVRRIVRALRRAGYATRVIDGDDRLLRELRRFLPPDPSGAAPRGVVLHLADVRNAAGSDHVAAMLERSGIPYAGPTPQGHALLSDPVAVRALLMAAGVPTPRFHVLGRHGDAPDDLRFPMVVRPRHAPAAQARHVREPGALRRAVRRVVRRHRQRAFVEERVAGRRIRAALIGNDPLRCLPLVELAPGTREKICPAPLDKALARRIRACARAAFRATGCRDFARVDLRIGDAEDIQVIGVHSLGILARSGSFVRAAREAGMTFDALVRSIVEVARVRAGGPPTGVRIGRRRRRASPAGAPPVLRAAPTPPPGVRGCSRAGAGG